MTDRSPVPEFLTHSNWADFLQGFSLPFWALGVIFKSKKLLTLSIAASILSVALMIWLTLHLSPQSGYLVRFLVGRPRDWGRAGYYLVTGLTFVVLLVVAANTLPLLIVAPLQDPISEAAEEVCGDFDARAFSPPGFFRDSLVALGHTLARIGFLLLGHVVLWSLHLLPVIGTLLWVAVANIWTAGWLAAAYLDAPMARHLYPFTDVQGAIADRLRLCLGFGAAVYILLWIPIVHLFFVPMAIVGGTLLYRGLRANGTLGPPPLAV